MRWPGLLVAVLAALPGRGWAEDAPALPEGPLSVTGYALRLEEVLSFAEGGRLEEARARAQELRRADVEFAGERVGTDSTVLDGIASARTVAEARSRAPRIRRLVAALRGTRGAEEASDPQPEVLVRLSPRDDATKGGVVAAPLRARELSVPARVGQAVLAAYDWVVSVIQKVLDWLARFKPRKAPSAQQGGTTTAAIAVVAVAAVLLAVLAYRTLKRGRPATEEIEADRILSSAKDEDPLSREVGEWERHARDLAASGRWREAVRAWYHAVLVCLFQRGLLHYQKGRTNWEYASRLAPETAWRPTFLDMTRLFDREWYGRSSSDAEAVRECARAAREILGAVRGAEEPA